MPLERSLDGVTVLDLTRLLPGPFATQILADLGARVIKVEEPERGDYARWIPPDVDGHGFTFSAFNRGKESIAVNLKTAGGVGVVKRLAARADVLVESFRPGVLDRLGLGADVLREVNPRLVVLAMSGYGQSGPLRDAPGHDINYVGLSGITALTGGADRPVLPAIPVSDLAGGLYAALAVLAALRDRDRTGEGGVLDVALHDAALALNGMYLARAAAGDPPRRGALELAGDAFPAYDVYRCADDAWLALGALEPKFWARFCVAVDRPEWEDRHTDPAMGPELTALFAKDDRARWVERLATAGVPATPILDPEDVLDHAHVRARFKGAERPVPGPASPLTHRPLAGRVPDLGESTDAVLAEAGFDADEVRRLREEGAIGPP